MGGWGDSDGKKQKQGDKAKEYFYHENKDYDQSLQALKQSIKKTHGNWLYLSYLLKAGDHTIPEVLSLLGLNERHCGRFTLWGGCGDKDCTLLHDDTPLSAEKANELKAILTASAKKLPAPKTEKWLNDTTDTLRAPENWLKPIHNENTDNTRMMVGEIPDLKSDIIQQSPSTTQRLPIPLKMNKPQQ